MAMALASSSVAATAVVCKATSGRKATVLAPAAPTFAQKTVSNGIKTRQMMVWQPTNNKYFETLSFLPPLSQDEIAKQVDYITSNGWTPCIEFANAEDAYVANHNAIRMGAVTSGYQDNRYWTMFKLPMFGCSDASQVLKEIKNCTTSFPQAYVRLVAFDAVRQVQMIGFLVHRPASANDYRQPADRSI